MAIAPLTHHEILGLIEPFARRGRRVDLARSDRLARRLVFASIEHAAETDGVPARSEALALDLPPSGPSRLTRSLVPAAGLEAVLRAEGKDLAALLEAIESIPHARQLRSGEGFIVASSHRLETSGGLRLTHGATSVAGTMLALTMPTHGGRRADVSLTTRLDDPIDLPEDLLAVLGRDWSGLDRWTERAAVRWAGSVRLRGRGAAEDADAERKLERAAAHVAATLAEPPARFHERRHVARWFFAFRRAIPLLACIALIVAAFTFTKAGMSQDSVVRMLLFNAPPLLLVAFFSLRELAPHRAAEVAASRHRERVAPGAGRSRGDRPMSGNPMNLPPVSIAAVKAALIEQYADPVLRRRASMLWGTRGVGKSSVVRQVAEHFGIPLVDLRLTTIEPVDIRGAIYADDVLGRTVWFPPEFLPSADQPDGILFLDELTAADQRLQISAYSLILDRRVGHYRLPDGWQVVAAGNASFHGAVSHDMGTALADRMFHFNVQTTIDAFLAHAAAMDFAPEVMAYLRVRPDQLDDTQAQLAHDHLVGASPRGWEDISNILESNLSEASRRLFVQGRIGAANAASFFGVLRELQAGADVVRLLAAARGADTTALLPTTLDGLYGLVYGLLAAASDARSMGRALEIVEQFPDIRGPQSLPIRECQTLVMELLLQKGIERGLEVAVLDSPAYRRYADRRRDDRGGA